MPMAAIIAAMRTKMKRLPLVGALLCALTIVAPLAAQRPERPELAISAYSIDAEIDTATHHLAAKAVVSFTAPDRRRDRQLRLSPRAQSHQNHRRSRQGRSRASGPPTAPSA